MSPRLPPPDPFETIGWAPAEHIQMEAPAAVYVGVSPTADARRISSVILDLRPGALIVFAPTSVDSDPPSG